MSEALSFQVYALDTLLLSNQDSKVSTLTRRLNGLLGFDLRVDSATVQRLYDLRSGIVHDGDYAAVTPHDLYLADLFTANAIRNVIVRRTLWRDKQQAQRITSRCGQANAWPKRLRLVVSRRSYREADYEHLRQ
jgi:hypothetical protein